MSTLREDGPSTRLSLISSLVIAALAAQAAAAQEQELETIIVTASRRVEPLQTTASSVTAISGNFLVEHGARDIREVMSAVPGLAIVSGVDTKYILRGISTDVWEELRPATAEYLDETPITNPGAWTGALDTLPYLIDMDRVEVLRGPQGTLFGSSSMGGTVRYMTRRPSLDHAESWVEFGTSATAEGSPGWLGQGMFNAPLREGVVALRGVGFYELQGGYIDNLTTGVDDVNETHLYGGRLALEWRPDDRLTAITRLNYQDQTNDGHGWHDLGDPPYSQSRQGDETSTAQRFVASLDIDYLMPTMALHSTTSWTSYDATMRTDLTDYMLLVEGLDNPLTAVSVQDTEEFTQELRLESRETGRFDWLAGLYFQHRDSSYAQDFPAPGFDAQTGGAAAEFGYPDNLYVLEIAQPVDEFAGYGEAGWHPSEKWRLAAGARWFRFDREEHEVADGYWNGGPTDRRGEATESDVSPRLSASYTPSDDRTYYAVISNGYRPGGPNLGQWNAGDCDADLAELGYDSAPTDFTSDELWNYEIGARRMFQDGRLSVAGAVYRIDWSDIQTLVFLDCGWGFVQNNGEARNDGVEFELSYLATPDIDLRLAAGYVDARLESPIAGRGGQPGDPIPGVPDVTGSLSAAWRFFTGSSFSATIRGLWNYVGERYTASDETTRLRMDAYDVLNLRLQIDSDRWGVALMADNVFDDDGVVYVENNAVNAYEVLLRPRTLRLTVRYGF
jgi:outer membrane receptor protein involved in Fe transport